MTPGSADQFSTDYQYIAASQTNVKITGQKGAGKKGDLIRKLILIPSTVSPGPVSIKDDTGGSAITVWAGGAGGLVANLEARPVIVDMTPGARSVTGPWYITTGANVTALVIGRFQ